MNLLQQTTTVNIPKIYSSLEKASEFVRKRWQSTRRTIKSNEFAFATPWLPDLLCKQWFTSSLFFFSKQICIWNPWLPGLLCKQWFTSSVWNFCRWVADVGETSLAARGYEKRQYSQATPIDFKFSSARHEAISNRTMSRLFWKRRIKVKSNWSTGIR